MVNCSAIGCTNRSAQFPDREVVFHKLPRQNKSLRQQWLSNIRREGTLPKDISIAICSTHFKEACYKRDFQAATVLLS